MAAKHAHERKIATTPPQFTLGSGAPLRKGAAFQRMFAPSPGPVPANPTYQADVPAEPVIDTSQPPVPATGN